MEPVPPRCDDCAGDRPELAHRPAHVPRYLAGPPAADPADHPALHAEGALCPVADHHHGAGRPPAVRRHRGVHGASLAARHPAPVGGGGAGYRRDHRARSDAAARLGLQRHHPHRPQQSRPQRFGAAGRAAAAACPEAVFQYPRRHSQRGTDPADRPPVLDRHRRQFQDRRDPHPAGRPGDADLRHPQLRLCVQHAHLPRLDGWHIAGADDHRGAVPAQPDPADPDPGGRGGRLRPRPADAAGLPASRCFGSPTCIARLHPDARPDRTADGTADRHADRRKPRSADHSHPLSAAAGAARRRRGPGRAQRRCRRDAAHARGLSGLRPKRGGRGDRRTRSGPDADQVSQRSQAQGQASGTGDRR